MITNNIVEAVSSLKQQTGQNILVGGSGALARTLMQHDVIDEYWLLVYPLMLGNGKRLFEGVNDRLNLKFVSAKTFRAGSFSFSTSLKGLAGKKRKCNG